MRYSIKTHPHGEVIASGIADDTVHDLEGNWYFAPEAVNMQYLKVTKRLPIAPNTCSYKGTCFWIDLEAPDARAANIAWVYQNPKPGYEFIKDQIGFYVRNASATAATQEPD